MRYIMLRKLRNDLYAKSYRTTEEQQLLEELGSLGKIIDIEAASLSLASNVCKTCGRPL